jgi:hypothetical protein
LLQSAKTWMAWPSHAMTMGHEPCPDVIRLCRTGP